MTIEQTKTLHGKYQTTHLFTKLDTLDKKVGIALFVHNDFKIIKRGSIYDDDIEYLTVEVLRNTGKNFFLYLQTSER